MGVRCFQDAHPGQHTGRQPVRIRSRSPGAAEPAAGKYLHFRKPERERFPTLCHGVSLTYGTDETMEQELPEV